ncbi:MAG: hypothetical protein FI692_07075 [SAR202 cluster bacterium]|nr:hypothetical protein [SAR202 cluster bacterium]
MANKKYGIQDILSVAYKVIAVFGYTPKNKQTEDSPATAGIIERVVKGFDPQPEVVVDAEEIQNAVQHFVSRKDSYERGVTDFDRTLGDILDRGVVTAKQFGFIATVLPSYRNSIIRQAERAEKILAEAEAGKNSEWVGVTKGRQEFTATIESARDLNNAWGTFLVKMLDEESNHLVWFASGDPVWDFGKVGDTLTFKATVKDHSEYNGIKQTVINRCKVV